MHIKGLLLGAVFLAGAMGSPNHPNVTTYTSVIEPVTTTATTAPAYTSVIVTTKANATTFTASAPYVTTGE
ncbi:hypothetical protein FRC07_009669 [Ceratobasidium sp. 392]|nr:hypothetical protein FRC07_009669 [Ceratobasidium sp. 392]